MVIQCENCKRKYRLDDSRIKPPGSSVRCSKCGHIFFAPKKEHEENEDKLIMSEETPLFEDLKEEIGTIEKSNEDLEKQVAVSDTKTDLTQGELGIKEDKGERDNDMLDLPTEHEEDLEEFIDKSEDRGAGIRIAEDDELQNVGEHKADLDSDEKGSEEETANSIPATPDLLEAEDNEEGKIDKEASSGNKLESIPAEAANIDDNMRNNELDEPHIGTSGTPAGTHIPKSGAGIFARIIYTLITIAALFVIFMASLVILIDAQFLPEGTLSNLTSLVEPFIPLELTKTKEKVIIVEHGGRWMNTVNGPIYIVSGLITNESQVPVHYVKLRSEYIAAEKTQFEDIFYAGNTFTDNELKASPIQNILSKLKQRNGDIDVTNSRKLAGLNYNIQPGESIPFFSIFPADGRMLGLRYNLQVIGYEESTSN